MDEFEELWNTPKPPRSQRDKFRIPKKVTAPNNWLIQLRENREVSQDKDRAGSEDKENASLVEDRDKTGDGKLVIVEHEEQDQELERKHDEELFREIDEVVATSTAKEEKEVAKDGVVSQFPKGIPRISDQYPRKVASIRKVSEPPTIAQESGGGIKQNPPLLIFPRPDKRRQRLQQNLDRQGKPVLVKDYPQLPGETRDPRLTYYVNCLELDKKEIEVELEGIRPYSGNLSLGLSRKEDTPSSSATSSRPLPNTSPLTLGKGISNVGDDQILQPTEHNNVEKPICHRMPVRTVPLRPIQVRKFTEGDQSRSNRGARRDYHCPPHRDLQFENFRRAHEQYRDRDVRYDHYRREMSFRDPYQGYDYQLHYYGSEDPSRLPQYCHPVDHRKPLGAPPIYIPWRDAYKKRRNKKKKTVYERENETLEVRSYAGWTVYKIKPPKEQ